MKNNTHYNNSNGTGISGKHRARINRDTEFRAIYRRALVRMFELGVPNPRKAAVEYTVMNGRPHYHVSYDRAYIVVRKILHDGRTPVKPSLQALMWHEIAAKTKELIDNEGLTLPVALQQVLDSGRASRFFITPQYAYCHIPHTPESTQNLS